MSEPTIAEQLLPAFEAIGEKLVGKSGVISGQGVGSDAVPQFAPHPAPVLAQSDSGLASIYSPWVVRVADLVPTPLGEFYLYYSTDHAGANGRMAMAYADHPLGPWTVHAPGITVTGEPGGTIEPETPAVVPAPGGGLFLYYQLAGINGSQGTVYAWSADGVAWEHRGVAVGQRLAPAGYAYLPGDGHMGYFRPVFIGGARAGFHLFGGGNRAGIGISYSRDGENWVLDPRRIGRFAEWVSPGNLASVRDVFWWRGLDWALLGEGPPAGGLQGGFGRDFLIAPVAADGRGVTAHPVRAIPALDPATTAVDLWGQVLRHSGRIYLYYRAGGPQGEFRVAVGEA